MPPKRKAGQLDESNILEDSKKRKRREPWAAVLAKLPAYWEGPSHTPHQLKPAGARKLEVVLGPNARNDRANDAASNLPSGITAAREKYPQCKFKAGHVLNCDLGGNGKNAQNLTILSAKGNTSMTLPDNALKRAADDLRRVYEGIYNSDPMPDTNEVLAIKYGIQVEITISKQTWGEEEPDCFICNFLTYSVHEWGSVPAPYQSDEVKKAMDKMAGNIRSAHGSKVMNKKSGADDEESEDE